MTDYRGDSPMEEFGGGDGSSMDAAFLISTPGQLKTLVIESRRNTFKGKHFRLGADFRITTDKWEPVGSTPVHCFSGIFNGDGHSIEGVLENADRQKLFGFFGYLKDATVTNLKMKATINNTTDNTVYCYTGSIAGYCNRSAITECSNTGKIEAAITGSIYTGGIAGISYNHSLISHCTNSGEINGESTQNAHIGGIAGNNTTCSAIINCTNTGAIKGMSSSIEANNEIYVGGISGRNSQSSHLMHSINHAAITGYSRYTSAYTGGIAGQSTHYCSIKDCCNLSAIIRGNGGVAYTGGIGGNNDTFSSIEHCTNRAAVTGQGHFSSFTGGIAGFNLVSQIYDCCKNTGSVNQRLPDKGNNYLRVEGNPRSVIPCPNGHSAT